MNLKTGNYEDTSKRHADVYVFALLKEKDDKVRASRLDVTQWAFYVVPTFRLNKRKRSQTSITLKSLEEEEGVKAKAVNYSELKMEVLAAATKLRSSVRR